MAAKHVFFKRIVEIEGVVLGEGEIDDVAVDDFDIGEVQGARGLERGGGEVGALLDPGEMRVAQGGGDEAELARAAADIEDAGARRGDEKLRRLGGDPHRRPLNGGELPDAGGIDLVELLVFDAADVLDGEVLIEILAF